MSAILALDQGTTGSTALIIGADGHKKKQFEGVTRRKASAHKSKN